MRTILTLLRKDLIGFVDDKPALALTFLVPMALIYVFGHVFGLYRKDTGPIGIPLAVVNLSPEPAATQLIDALRKEKAVRLITETTTPDGKKRPLTEAAVRAGLRDNQYRFALLLPADLLPDDSFGIRLKFLTNPRNEIEAQMVNGLLQKTVFSNVPQLLGQSLNKSARRFVGPERFERFQNLLADNFAGTFGWDREETLRRIGSFDFASGQPAPAGTAPSTGSAAKREPAANDVFSRIVRIETEQVAGKEVKNPMAARLIGGYAIMFLLFALSGTATSLFDEKKAGLFQRLLAAPVRRGHILGAKFLFGVLLGLVQLTVMFSLGGFLYGLDLGSHVPALFAVGLAGAAACTAFGLLIAAFAPTLAAASGMATFLVLMMSAVGGAWFPVSLMPEFMQALSKFTIVYWAVEGFTDVLWAGQSTVDVLPKVGVLAGAAAAVMSLALWRFRHNAMFD
jgi:ABC-2 type transport system permease protein